MREYLIGSSMRLFVFIVGSVIWVGILLTGFATVHWLPYLPPSFFYFAAITGICPGMIISRLILGDTPRKQTDKG
jgi:Na+-transporting NADH:ubiquinone oxidoreductase subunit NqrB